MHTQEHVNGTGVSVLTPNTETETENPDAQKSVVSPAPKTHRIDVARLRLDQTFEAGRTRKTIGNIPVRKPDRMNWFMASQTDELQTVVLDYRADQDREIYLIDRDLRPDYEIDLTPVVIVPCITRQNNVFLWPVRLPDQASGRESSWTRSARAALELAKDGWVRIMANMQTGAYDVYHPRIELDPPVWPEMTFEQMIQKAFKDFMIDRPDHPRLLTLRGEI